MVKELSHYVRVTCLSNNSSGNIQRLVEEYAIAARARTGGVYRVDPSPLWGIVEGKPQLTNAKQRKSKSQWGNNLGFVSRCCLPTQHAYHEAEHLQATFSSPEVSNLDVNNKSPVYQFTER